MKKRNEFQEQDEGTNALHALEAAFGDDGLRRSKRAIGDLLHFIDEKHGPKVALVCQLRLLGLMELTSWRFEKNSLRIRSKKKFERRFRVSFDVTVDHDEIGDFPLYD